MKFILNELFKVFYSLSRRLAEVYTYELSYSLKKNISKLRGLNLNIGTSGLCNTSILNQEKINKLNNKISPLDDVHEIEAIV